MNSALLVMDVQQGVVERHGVSDGLLGRLRQAVTAARNACVPVVFVRVAFRPGFPDVSPANRSFSTIAGTAGDNFGENSPATQIHPALAPRPGEPVVVKKRVSAFTGSDLDVLLRSMSVTHLLLTGIATSGVVLSTLREAADRDYQPQPVRAHLSAPPRSTQPHLQPARRSRHHGATTPTPGPEDRQHAPPAARPATA